MLIKTLQDCKEFIAGDNTMLREMLHPDKEDLKLRYSFAHAVLKPGETSLWHRLKTAYEVYYILEGQGIMFIDDELQKVSSGQTIYIPPNAQQRIRNTGTSDLKFICIVDPAWKKEDEEVLHGV